MPDSIGYTHFFRFVQLFPENYFFDSLTGAKPFRVLLRFFRANDYFSGL